MGPEGPERLLQALLFLLQHLNLPGVEIVGLPGGAGDSLEGGAAEAVGLQNVQRLFRLIPVTQEKEVVHLRVGGGLIEL